MPINLKNYPKDWKEISQRAKARAGWTCVFCGERPTKHNPLTTHHIDGDPSNNTDNNLVSLHASHHLLFHTVYSKCKTVCVFKEICENHKCQISFSFVKEFDATESGGKFINYKIRSTSWRKKCLQSSSAAS